MIENTISIDSAEALEAAAETAEETAVQQAEALTERETDTAAQQAEGEQQHGTEEETIPTDEEMLTLTVYGDTVTVPKSEAINAAQRGIAFDRIKEKYSAAKADARLKALDGLAQISGTSVSHLLGDMAGQMLAEKLAEKYGDINNAPSEEIEAVMQQVLKTRKSVQQAADRMAMADKHSQLEEFLQYNPGCTEIPPQVIERARKGENLSLCYSQHQTAQLTQQLEALQRELEQLKSSKAAKAKSMPSAKSTVADSRTNSIYGMMKSLW